MDCNDEKRCLMKNNDHTQHQQHKTKVDNLIKKNKNAIVDW